MIGIVLMSKGTDATFFHVIRTVPNVELPVLTGAGSYELSIISKTDDRTDDSANSVNMYRTGLIFRPNVGECLIVSGKKDLPREGYMLPSNIIISHDEEEKELIVPLFKFDAQVEDLDCPYAALNVHVVKQSGSLMRLDGPQEPVEKMSYQDRKRGRKPTRSIRSEPEIPRNGNGNFYM